MVIFSVQFLDGSYIKTFILSANDFLKHPEKIRKYFEIPVNKYILKETNSKLENASDARRKINFLILRSKYKYYSNFFKKYSYFLLTKQKYG